MTLENMIVLPVLSYSTHLQFSSDNIWDLW